MSVISFLFKIPAQICHLLIGAYQVLISPILGSHCRFFPSCSEYTKGAITEHGVVRGIGLGIERICRCSGLSAGGMDPVPAKKGKLNSARESNAIKEQTLRSNS